MDYKAIRWDGLPDVITKEQFYKLCHISKATARKLLQSGEVPCEYTGKKTSCYKIRKEDARLFLIKRAMLEAGTLHGQTLASKKLIYSYFTAALDDYPDVLKAEQVASFTGYSKTAVNNWCAWGWLRSFKKARATMVPKVFLVEHLCSEHFWTIRRKTLRHIVFSDEILRQEALPKSVTQIHTSFAD